MAKKAKQVAEDLSEEFEESEGAEDEPEDEDDGEDKPRTKAEKRMVAVMADAFETAIKRVRGGKGKKPPSKPEKGFFESIAEFFGVDE